MRVDVACGLLSVCLTGMVIGFSISPGERTSALHDPSLPFWTQAAPSVYRVKMHTSKGDVLLEVNRSWAPVGADRFYHLVEVGFYDDLRFFRVIKGRFAQFGIPGNPAIATIWRTQSISDDPVRASNVRGTFAFAMTGPNARTTQIYINTADQVRQDAMGFAPLGKVVQGMEVIDSLYSGYEETSGGGMRAGHQGKLFEEGNSYLDRSFPNLDKLFDCEVLPSKKVKTVFQAHAL